MIAFLHDLLILWLIAGVVSETYCLYQHLKAFSTMTGDDWIATGLIFVAGPIGLVVLFLDWIRESH